MIGTRNTLLLVAAVGQSLYLNGIREDYDHFAGEMEQVPAHLSQEA